MPLLEVNNVSISFGGINALSDINMEIKEGEIAGLIGPNGAGKTTFFNLLTGIYSPTKGEIIYSSEGKNNLNKIKPHKAASIGISRTFQNIRLFKDMNVLDNVRLGFHSNIKYGTASSFFRFPSFYKDEKKVHDETMELLDIFNLADKKNELASNLPYGEQRRVEIARALAVKPKILLLDEPAAGMNPNETRELMELIKWIKDKFNLTIILIEHDMSLVMGICSRVFVFNYGHLIADGTPDEVQNNQAVIKAYLGGEQAC